MAVLLSDCLSLYDQIRGRKPLTRTAIPYSTLTQLANAALPFGPTHCPGILPPRTRPSRRGSVLHSPAAGTHHTARGQDHPGPGSTVTGTESEALSESERHQVRLSGSLSR
eukprot:648516-Hanusia_phi.AAC.1